MEKTLTFEELDAVFSYAPYVLSLSDGPGNELTIIVAACVHGERDENFFQGLQDIEAEGLRNIIAGGTPLIPDYNDMYKIHFRDYIIYEMRNESYCCCDDEEVCSGKYMHVFEKSKLLSHLPVVTFVQDHGDGTYFPGKWKHYGIYTLNHIVDVISCGEPTISPYKSRLHSTSSFWQRLQRWIGMRSEIYGLRSDTDISVAALPRME